MRVHGWNFAKYPISNFSKIAWHNFRTQIVRFEGDIKEVDLQNVIEELSKFNMIPLGNVRNLANISELQPLEYLPHF